MSWYRILALVFSALCLAASGGYLLYQYVSFSGLLLRHVVG